MQKHPLAPSLTCVSCHTFAAVRVQTVHTPCSVKAVSLGAVHHVLCAVPPRPARGTPTPVVVDQILAYGSIQTGAQHITLIYIIFTMTPW